MTPNPLDDLLAAYAKQPMPTSLEPPSTVEVWSEIERRRRRSGWTRFFPLLDWREVAVEPRLALSAVGLALAVGLVPAYLLVQPVEESRRTRASLHFQVFSSQTPLVMLARSGPEISRPHP